MRVVDAMSAVVLSVGIHHSVQEAARLMAARHVGAAIVVDDSLAVPGIITERDVLGAVAEGRDLATLEVGDIMTFEARTASAAWDLDIAAEQMVRHGFRHLLVADDRGQLIGVVSMRDIVRARVRTPAEPA